MPSLRFGDFILAPEERKLTRGGIELTLGARAFDMLSFLVANRHRVLSKGEILDAVWPDIAVEESNLTVHVSALRKALGSRSMATIPGRGYQFVLPVEEVAPDPTPDAGKRANARPRILVLPFNNGGGYANNMQDLVANLLGALAGWFVTRLAMGPAPDEVQGEDTH